MTWILANVIPALVIWAACAVTPLWLVLRRRYAEGVHAHSGQARVSLPADRRLRLA